MVHYKGENFMADTISLETLYQWVDESGEFPKTTSPPLSEFLSIFEDLTKKGFTIIALPPPESLSASMKVAEAARAQLSSEDQKNVYIINSHQGSVGLGFLVECTLRTIKENPDITPPNLISFINTISKKIALMGAIKTLDYLLKGGRIGKVKYLMASFLNYQPLFYLQNDEVQPLGRTRSREKAITEIVDFTVEKINSGSEFYNKNILIGHVLCENDAVILKNLLIEKLPDITIEFAVMGPLVGAHTGPGTLRVAFYSK